VAARRFNQSRKKPPGNSGALYPALIAARRQSYEALAHCTLEVAALARWIGWTPSAFLK